MVEMDQRENQDIGEMGGGHVSSVQISYDDDDSETANKGDMVFGRNNLFSRTLKNEETPAPVFPGRNLISITFYTLYLKTQCMAQKGMMGKGSVLHVTQYVSLDTSRSWNEKNPSGRYC